jgi:hypothetical protein
MTGRTEIRKLMGGEILSDDQLRAVAGGTTFRVDAETDESTIVYVPHKIKKGK